MRVNDVVGVAGFALPGSFVDIIVNTQKDKQDGKASAERLDQSISKIVLEKILVLAVAQEVNRDETKPKVVNAVSAGSVARRGREGRPGTQRGLALAGAAQPDGPAPGRDRRRPQAFLSSRNP